MKPLLYLVLLGIYSSSLAQSASEELTSLTTTRVEMRKKADTIPFEFVKNKILIPVIIGGETKKFIFDTGAPLLISTHTHAAQGYQVIANGDMHDVNNVEAVMSFVEVGEITIGNTVFRNNIASIYNFDSSPLNCLGVEGIIGSNMLKGLVVKIDLKNKQLILTDREDFFEAPREFTSTIKTDQQNLPIVTLSPFNYTTEDVLFDTGDDSFYSLSTDNFLIFQENDDKIGFSKYILYQGEGGTDIGMHGNEKDSLKYLLKTDDFTINQTLFKNVHTVTTYGQGSRLGADILNYGEVILDFINYNFSFIPYEHNVSSVVLPHEFNDFYMMLEDGSVKISLIWPQSTAYKAGLRKGYTIVQINELVVDSDLCNVYLNTMGVMDEKEIRIKALDLEGKENEYWLQYN